MDDMARHEKRAQRSRGISRKEAERLANRISKALDGANLKLTHEDDVADYCALMGCVGRLLVVHHWKNGKRPLAKSLAEGLMDGLQEWGDGTTR